MVGNTAILHTQDLILARSFKGVTQYVGVPWHRLYLCQQMQAFVIAKSLTYSYSLMNIIRCYVRLRRLCILREIQCHAGAVYLVMRVNPICVAE